MFGSAVPSNTNTSGGGWSKGEEQGSAFRDIGFAILYYLQLIIVIVVAIIYGPSALDDTTNTTTDDTKTSDDYMGYVNVALIVSAFAIVISTILFASMTRLASVLIKTSLIFSVVLAGVFAVVALLSGSAIGGILGLIFFAIFVCYARAVWPRIPFATANMVTAIAAIRANWGLVIISCLTLLCSFAITMATIFAIIGTTNESETCDENGQNCKTSSGGGYIFLFLVSLFWTQQVMKNTIHVIGKVLNLNFFILHKLELN